MDEVMRNQIVGLLDTHRKLTLATLRPDGWPHAPTVGYGNEGLNIYFLCGSRKSGEALDAALSRSAHELSDPGCRGRPDLSCVAPRHIGPRWFATTDIPHLSY